MSKNKLYSVLAASTLVVLVISAIVTVPALADGGTTSATTTTSSGRRAPSSSPAAVPSGTKVVIVDDQGNKLPLGSQAAQDILASGDPVWCPTGIAPNNLGVSGCSSSYGSLASLVSSFTPAANGTIWVASGAALAGAPIDGSGSWSADKNFSLTVQGGWNNVNGSTALDSTNPYSTFSGIGDDFLSITHWVGPVTLKNLIFNSAVYNLGYSYQTLNVATQGNIILDKVQVNNAMNSDVSNTATGAFLNNDTGTGTVTVTNSQFNNNESIGLQIYSKGNVTLKNVAADLNGNSGVYIDNGSWPSIPKGVSVSGAEFKDNGYRGLEVYSGGSLTLSNLTATHNMDRGVSVDNTYLSMVMSVALSGVNNFSDNGNDGLNVLTEGPITVSNVTADDNGNVGVSLENDTAPTAQLVSILGSLTAIGNASDGLDIYSRGAVTAANLTSNHNGYGASISNGGPFVEPVTLSGSNVFNDNGQYGLYVSSKGTVMLNNLIAEHDGYTGTYDGVHVSSGTSTIQSALTLTGNNLMIYNTGNGLGIGSFGTVTLNNLTAVGNIGDGVNVDNTGGTSAKTVTLNGTNVFSENDQNGLYVKSDGAIKVYNVTASDNQDTGLHLQNAAATQASVTISGYGLIERNGYDFGAQDYNGLVVTSHGAITLANINANYNYLDGANLNTIGITTPQAVLLSGTNTFNWNGYSGSSAGAGLVVNTDGSITVNNLTGSQNTGDGASLDNQTNWALHGNPAFGSGSVLLAGFGNFDGNSAFGVSGLYVNAHGAVTLNHASADMNSAFVGTGISVVSAAGNATLVCSSAYGNSGLTDGLYVKLAPAHLLTLKGFSAYNNAGSDENFDFSGGAFTVTQTTCP